MIECAVLDTMSSSLTILLSSGIACRTHSLQDTERFARDLGYDGLELMLPPRHRQRANESQDDLAMLSSVRAVHASNDYFDEERFRASLHDAVKVARTVGAPAVTIHPPSAYFGGRTNIERGITLIKETQRSSSITIGYEILARAVGTDEAWREHIARQRAYPGPAPWLTDVLEYDLAATLDTCHVATWNEDPTSYIDALGSHLVHVHCSDYDARSSREHLVPGTGNINLSTFLPTLAARTPAMTLTVEVNPCQTPAESVQAARESIQFIRDTLR